MGVRPLSAGTIYGSAPFIRRDDIWVCALYTQGLYILGSVPFIHRDAGQGFYIRVCAHIHRGLARDYIYIFIDIYISICGHMMCLSHTRVVPILDVPTCSQGTRPVTECLHCDKYKTCQHDAMI